MIQVEGNRITIFEALAICGDVTMDGLRDNVKIIRYEDGEPTVGEIDLTSASALDSPFYYLKQNDIIYVEPNENKVREESRRNLQWIFTGTSLLTTVISIITLIKK